MLQLPSATTGWSEQLSVDAGVGTGTFSCEQLKLAYNGATPDGANTKYSYTLTGGGPNPITCKEIAWVQLAGVRALNGALVIAGGAIVLSETHPGVAEHDLGVLAACPTANEIRWTSISGGSGPFTAQFTFDLPADPAPMVATAPQVLLKIAERAGG